MSKMSKEYMEWLDHFCLVVNLSADGYKMTISSARNYVEQWVGAQFGDPAFDWSIRAAGDLAQTFLADNAD